MADRQGERVLVVRSPWDARVVRRVPLADAADVEMALARAAAALPQLRAQSSHARRAVLAAVREGLRARADELVDAIVDEAGKPVALAKNEVMRAQETFALAEAEAARASGEIVAVDGLAAAAGAEAEVRRFACGVVVGIVPFNFPLNLGAHKVAPALAVGAPLVIKPPLQAPTAQLILADIVRDAGAPEGALQVVVCNNELAERMASDARVRVLSFTGSAQVGWHLRSRAAARVVLELGGNAAALVCDDADVALAAKRLTLGAWAYAGQVCIKTQRILVDERIADAFIARFLEETAAVRVGDPRAPGVLVGPLIDARAAERVRAWVAEAEVLGARVLFRGTDVGPALAPVVLTGVPPQARVWCDEVFGPVTCIERVASFDEGLMRLDDSTFGLQAALFTKDAGRARRAFHALDVGAVILNDATTFRSDAMPYGGNKRSGLGREGVRSSMDEMTEPRVLVWR